MQRSARRWHATTIRFVIVDYTHIMRIVTYIPPTQRSKMTKARRTRIFVSRNGICGICGLQITGGELWDIEHPKMLARGGSDNDADLWPVHVGKKGCHKKKTAEDRRLLAKENSVLDKGYAGKKRRHSIPGSKASGIRKRMSGRIERWPV